METTLNNLIEQVRGQIRDKGPEPVFSRAREATENTSASADELEEFVQRAVRDYSGFRPLQRPGQIDLLPGRMVYDLPPDFISMDVFPSNHRLSGKTLHLLAAPTGSALSFWYYAVHTAETVPEIHHPALVQLAAANALRALVSDPQKLKKYSSYEIPGVFKKDGENSTEIGKEILRTASEYEKQYLARVNVEAGDTKGSTAPVIMFG